MEEGQVIQKQAHMSDKKKDTSQEKKKEDNLYFNLSNL